MRTKKILTIAIFYAAVILTGCGTKDEFDTPGTKDALSMDEATKIAREDAKVSESELENLHARLNDEAEYTVTFTTDQKSYEYCIAASDGMILEKNVKKLTPNTPSPTVGEEQISPSPTAPAQTAEISQEDALAIAKKDAGVSDKEIFNLEVKLDKEDGIRVYEIEFDTTKMEYEYDIAISDGKIVNRKTEQKDNLPPKPTVTSKPATATPKPTVPAQTAEISQEDALAIAKKDAGVSDKEIFNLEVKLDKEDGIRVYEIEFDTTKMEYEYDIAISDGKIVNRKTEQKDNLPPKPTVTSKPATATPKPTVPAQTAEISQEDALAIAKKDAGVSDKEIFNLEVKLDKEDGIRIYEIEFDTTEMEYEYDIAVSDGRIINRKTEAREHISANAPVTSTSIPSTEITQDTALSLAAKDAGISESEIFNLKIKFDDDDGIHVYKIEFDAGIYEYEYKIAALDGTILEKEMEESDELLSLDKNQGAENEITREDALVIAKKDAGILDGELFDLEIKLDDDDGIWYYDIEFCCNGCEYEYEIGTLDGKIWKREHDNCDHSWHHFDNSHH